MESNAPSKESDPVEGLRPPPAMIHWCIVHASQPDGCGTDDLECKSFCGLALTPMKDDEYDARALVVDCVVCHYMKFEVV